MTKRGRKESSDEPVSLGRGLARGGVGRGDGGEGLDASPTRIVRDEHQCDGDDGEEADHIFGAECGWDAGAEHFGESGAGETGGENEREELEGGFHGGWEVALPFAPAMPSEMAVRKSFV